MNNRISEDSSDPLGEGGEDAWAESLGAIELVVSATEVEGGCCWADTVVETTAGLVEDTGMAGIDGAVLD